MSEPAGSATEAKHILIAEDDDSLREMLSKYLLKKGFRITAVPDGKKALEALAAGGVDLCVLDVMMPELTGFEVLEQARGRGDTTPIVMATATAQPEQIVDALENGADDYVTKPYALAVLAARIALRLRAESPVHAASVPARHTMDLPVTDDDVEDELPDLPGSDGTQSEQVLVTDERSLFGRLRSMADAFKKRRDTAIDIVPGQKIADRYTLIEKIGDGGYGVVFRARHLDLGQDVALKLLRAGTGESTSAALEAFRREAQNACRVKHDNAVRVLDFGVERGVPYLVMEMLNGRDVEAEVLKNGALPVARATHVAKSVLSALAAAHALGIVHRDVKPHNVVLHKERGREVPKLLDFGIAKGIHEKDAAGVVVGSAAYIAPERVRMQPYDGRADVYSLGIVLYWMLTGTLPFDAPDDVEATVRFHLDGTIPPPSTRQRGLSRTIDTTVLKLLQRDANKRPTADEAEALVEQLVWEAELG